MKKMEIPGERGLWKSAGYLLSPFLSTELGMNERTPLEMEEITTGRQ